MTNGTRANADVSAPTTVELRLYHGDLVRRVTEQHAGQIVRAGIGDWIGTGRRRYVRLVESVSLFTGASQTTRRDRADYLNDRYKAGQPFSGPWRVEHRPL